MRTLPPAIPAMALDPSTTETVVRLSLATLLGALLGIEREARKKPAGLRTHMMVSLGAASFMLLALELYHELRETGATNSDPLRIVEGIATGIGFLGAGAILHRRGDVAGLTTAGSIWLAGAVGVASGGGHYVVAVSAVVLGLVVLRVVGIVEGRVFPHESGRPDR